jgi:hypothetical protein
MSFVEKIRCDVKDEARTADGGLSRTQTASRIDLVPSYTVCSLRVVLVTYI